jgi:micrococcal nuclease
MARARAASALVIIVMAVAIVASVVFVLSKLGGAGIGTASVPATGTQRTDPPPATPVPTASGVVTHVVDGDTLDVTLKGIRTRIRLLNVDTPETVKDNTPVQCMGPEASARLKQLAIVGSTVGLAFDVDRRDRYGRTLATVITASGENASEALAREGLGRAVRYGDNVAGYATVLDAEKRAKAARLGMWSGVCG